MTYPRRKLACIILRGGISRRAITMSASRSVEQVMERMKANNPFYEKYKDKIDKLQEMGSAEVVKRMRDLSVQPKVTAEKPKVTAVQHKVTAEKTKVTVEEHKVTAVEPKVTAVEPKVTAVEPKVTAKEPKVTAEKHEVTADDHEVTAEDEEVRNYTDLLNPKKPLVSERRQATPPWKKLSDIMKLELIADKSAEEIKQIWYEFHSTKNLISAVLTVEQFDTLMERAKKHPIFLLPLPRSLSYELILLQWSGNSVYFTPLLAYQLYHENSPECLSLNHYTEFRDKGIILMRGEYNRNTINGKGAKCLTNMLQMYYCMNDPVKLKIMENFTKEPTKFDYKELIEQVEKFQFKDIARKPTEAEEKARKAAEEEAKKAAEEKAKIAAQNEIYADDNDENDANIEKKKKKKKAKK